LIVYSLFIKSRGWTAQFVCANKLDGKAFQIFEIHFMFKDDAGVRDSRPLRVIADQAAILQKEKYCSLLYYILFFAVVHTQLTA